MRRHPARGTAPYAGKKCKPPLWWETLKGLTRLPDDLLLDTLLDPRSGFKSFLSTCNRDTEAIRTAVILLEKASSTPFPSQKLLELLSAVAFSESFMLLQLPSLLLDCKAKAGRDNVDVLHKSISLLTRLQTSLPATTAQHLVTLLPLVTDLVRSVEGALPRELGATLSDLEAMKDSFLAETHAREMVKQERLHASSPPDNFRDVPVIPLVCELVASTKPFLRPNIVRGAYADIDHYLDVQYRLLREDFVRPLREGLQKLLQAGMKIRRTDGINVYRNVQVGQSEITRGGIVHELLFKASVFRRVNWERTKRFMNDNLICLSNDNFQTIFFATVKGRDPNELKVGRLTVLFEDLFVQAITWNRYTMVETQIYFEAYKHNLLALQAIRAGSLPFYQYIVKSTPEVNSPAYMDGNTTYDISPLCKKSFQPRPVTILDENQWPPLEDIQLDASQLAAVKMALLKEFSVIQGPPGTGKTYIGLKIVEVLLGNISIWRRNSLPILVVCYTNHALDQFLEGILRTTDDIVRIGGRCSSESLVPFTLFNKRMETVRFGNDVREQYTELQKKLGALSTAMSAIYTVRCSYVNLEKHMSPRVQDSFRSRPYAIREGFGTWLELDALKRAFTDEFVHRTQDENPQDQLGEDEIEEEFDEDLETDRYDDDELYRRTGSTRATRAAGTNSAEIDKEHAWCLHLYGLVSADDRALDDQQVIDVWRLPVEERWKLYRYWASVAIEGMQGAVAEARAGVAEIKRMMEDEQLKVDLGALRKALVVGATTTGAAKNRALIQRLQPTIVVVEEAAEVLEAHVVTSLAATTQHLILIGDHKQLRPSSAVYELATRYKMEVSLFERMLTNGMACQQLEVQHRMRPEFTKLLVPHFYEKLENFPSVECYENVRGMDNNIFFVSHKIFEADEADTKSHTNDHEASFVVCLAEYLLNQEYDPAQITILTPYSGQMFLLKDLAKNRACRDVRITVVDNFQGEENDIIILSLVRSNPEKKVGFVKIPNRVCVSLSRARKGLYCIGNFDIIGQSSEIWKNIMKELQKLNAIGPELQLRCPNHPETVTAVKTKDDFAKVPEGGCGIPCTVRLNCGHSCGMLCHGYDRFHEAFKCRKSCERKCHNGHGCKLLCSEDCGKCTVPVLTQFQPCSHSCEIACHETLSPRCPLPCEKVFECGHKCPRVCSQQCESPCRALVTAKGECGHDVRLECHSARTGRVSDWCKAPCEKTLSCDHRCLRECRQDCLCTTLVMATGECGHECEVPCAVSKSPDLITRQHCDHPCEKTLKCGHRCLLKCKQRCTSNCEVVVTVDCKGGHRDEVRCFMSKSHRCKKDCTKTLDCGHLCRKMCFEDCGIVCHEIVQIKLACEHLVEAECSEQSWVMKLPCATTVPVKCGSDHVVHVTCADANNVAAIQMLCEAGCSKLLPCGHQCTLKCKEICSAASCKIKTFVDLQCGHKASVPCHVKFARESLKETQDELEAFYAKHKNVLTCNKQVQATCAAGHKIKVPCCLVDAGKVVPRSRCNAPCNVTLPCGHPCDSICSKCAEVKGHPPCTKRCQKILPCGHPCTDTCAQPCTICNERCKLLCVHRPCSLPCGYPCIPCCLPCRWKCEHAQCTVTCSEPCNREPCSEPCPKKLPCKHPCLGYCGEPCPNVCKVCKRLKHFKDVKGDVRFVLLLDCGHSVPESILSKLFEEARRDQTGPVQCPICKRKVTFSFRYGAFVREYMETINKEKMLVYDRAAKPDMIGRPEREEVDGAATRLLQLRLNAKVNKRGGMDRRFPQTPVFAAAPSGRGSWRQNQRDMPYSNGVPRGSQAEYNGHIDNTSGQRSSRGSDRGLWRTWRGGGQPPNMYGSRFSALAPLASGATPAVPRVEDGRNGVSERGGFSGRPRGRGRGGRGRGSRGGRWG
ncbi:NFX1-type zinc finger-containing protein 1-like [Ornithodoros turicata]|uniref:NFX1-type zinc finger-containing protein 1-like n=1 Tax=Ornithodoros turicata TaxID=34597 RepID=UPI0031387C48